MMNLNQEDLEMLSECILCKMNEVSSIKPVSPALAEAIQSELELLQNLNSMVCKELQLLNKKANSTEQ